MQVSRLRPLSATEVIEVAVKVYRAFFGSLVRPAAVVLVPAAVAYGVALGFVNAGGPVATREVDPLTGQTIVHWDYHALAVLLAALAVVVLVNLLALWVAQATCMLTVADGYLGGTVDWRRSFAFAWRRLGSVIWVVVLGAIGSLIGLACFILPGIFLYVAWFVAVPALLLEGQRGTRALGRSRRLVQGRWWPTFLTLLLMTLMVGIVGEVLRAIVTIVLGGVLGHGNVSTAVAVAVAYAVTQTVLLPFQVCVALVLYIDLRVRNEGYDLHLLASEVGISDWSGSPPTFLPGAMGGGFAPPAGWPPASGQWGGAPGWGGPAGGYGPPPGGGGGWPPGPGGGGGSWPPPGGGYQPPGSGGAWPPPGGYPPPAGPGGSPAPGWPPPSSGGYGAPPPWQVPAPDQPPPWAAPPPEPPPPPAGGRPQQPAWPAISPKPPPPQRIVGSPPASGSAGSGSREPPATGEPGAEPSEG